MPDNIELDGVFVTEEPELSDLADMGIEQVFHRGRCGVAPREQNNGRVATLQSTARQRIRVLVTAHDSTAVHAQPLRRIAVGTRGPSSEQRRRLIAVDAGEAPVIAVAEIRRLKRLQHNLVGDREAASHNENTLETAIGERSERFIRKPRRAEMSEEDRALRFGRPRRNRKSIGEIGGERKDRRRRKLIGIRLVDLVCCILTGCAADALDGSSGAENASHLVFNRHRNGVRIANYDHATRL